MVNTDTKPKLQRVVMEVFGGCNYACQMCPQSTGRDSGFTRKMPLPLFESILDQVMDLGDPVINLEGSGEPTMASDLAKYVQACTDRGLQSFMYCNGARLNGDFMKGVIDAGLNWVRFSVIGYNRELYKKWMSVDNFDLVLNNMIETREYIERSGADCTMSSYHLIMDSQDEQNEMFSYRSNVIEPTGSIGYIWKQHNWSGNLNLTDGRVGTKRSCGRPFANELTVRAGGNDGHRAAVTPCCQTMGPPNEEASVLGHLDDQTILDVWNGDAYNDLRQAHIDGEFDRISYCKNCDFLIDDPEVLVWTSDTEFKVNGMLGTDIDLTKGVDKPE